MLNLVSIGTSLVPESPEDYYKKRKVLRCMYHMYSEIRS